MLKRGISLLLCMIMVFSLLPLQAFAEEGSTEPTEILLEAEPEATETEPTEAETEPTEAETEPTEAETEPTEAETEPTEAETEATEAETEPTEAETEPTEAETEPTEAETEPTEAETEPTEAETEPAETEPVSGISTHPTREDWTPVEGPAYYVEVKPETFARTEEVRELIVDEQGHYHYDTTTETYETAMNVRNEIPLGGISMFSIREQNNRYYFTTFEDLKELASRYYSDYTYAYYEGEEPLVISEDLTLPENLRLRFYNENAKLVIDEGVTFTNMEGIVVDKLDIRGTFIARAFGRVAEELNLSGTLYVYSEFSMDENAILNKTGQVICNAEWNRFYRNVDVETMEELKSIAAQAKADKSGLEYQFSIDLYDDQDFTLTESVEIPANAELSIYGDEGRTFTIAQGVTLTLNGDYSYFNLPVFVNGTLVNNSELSLTNEETVTLTFSETGDYSGSGYITVTAQDWKTRVLGMENTGVKLWAEEWFYDDYYQMPHWKIMDVTGMTQLGTPFELTWHKGYEVYGRYDEKTDIFIPEGVNEYKRVGEIAWQAAEPHQGRFDIQIYREDEEGNISQSGHSWTFSSRKGDIDYYSVDSFSMDDPESGTYWFEVMAEADGTGYYSSPYSAPSAKFEYVKPGKTLGDPTNLRWEDSDWGVGFGAQFDHPVGSKDGSRYEVEFYFAPTRNSEPHICGSSWGTHWEDSSWSPWEEMIQRNGPGYYYFRVRAISDDITKFCNGEWSEMSAAYCLDETLQNVKDQLDQIPTKKTDAEEIREQVQALDTQELKDAMLADNGTEGIMDTLEKLENAAGGAAGVSVAPEMDKFDADKISVVGANLNNAAAESEAPITLVLDQPKEEHVLDAQFDNTVAVSFNMTLDNVEDAKNLAVPVKVTLPVPDSINPDFLVILHYRQDGGVEEISMPFLHIFKVDGVTYTSFVLDSFSDFVMTHYAENEVDGGASDEGATWSLSTWGNLTIDGEGAIHGAPWAELGKEILSVEIGAAVTGIDQGAFAECSNLLSFIIDAENECFYTEDGVLFAKGDEGSTILMAYPAGAEDGSYEVPADVDTIGAYAFYNTDVTYVNLGNVQVIGEHAFVGCQNLYSLDIPATVTKISEYAFAYMNLYNIWFAGKAPEIADNAFDMVGSIDSVCMAYYPSSDDSWTEDKLVGYGGNLYWSKAGYISITGDETVTAGKSVKLNAQILPEEFAGPKIYWELVSTDGEDVSTVASMKVSGSTATITAKDVSEARTVGIVAYATEDIAYASHMLTILPKAKLLTISEICDGQETALEADRVIRYGEALPTRLVIAAAEPEGASKAVTWKSSNTKLATINAASGEIKFVPGATGTVTFTATATDGSKTKATATYTVVEKTEAAIQGIENGSVIDLLSGKSLNLKVFNTITDKEIKAKNIRWQIWVDGMDADLVATINSSGKLTAKKVLQATNISVEGHVLSGNEEIGLIWFDAIIYPAVTHVKIAANGEMNNGEVIYYDWNDSALADGLRLTPYLYPTDVVNEEHPVQVEWKIQGADKFCDIEEDGNELVIRSNADKKTGTYTFKATAQDGSKKSASIKVMFGAFAKDVEIGMMGVEQLPDDLMLPSGETYYFAAEVLGKDGSNQLTNPGVNWSLSKEDKSFATLSVDKKSGMAMLKGKNVYKAQEITLIATSKDGMADDYLTLTVIPTDNTILGIYSEDHGNVTKDTIILDLAKEDTVNLYAVDYQNPAETLTNITWSPAKNSKTAEVTANEDGSFSVKMLKGGSVTVTAKEDGTKRKMTVTIKAVELVKGIEISEKKTNKVELTLASGKSLNLQAVPTNETASNKKVTWSLAEGDEAYASISSSGKLTAAKDLVSRHEITVIATAQDGSGVQGELEVTVAPVAQGIYVASMDPNGPMLMSLKSNFINRFIASTFEWDMAAQYADGQQMDRIYLDSRVYPFYSEDDQNNALQGVEWKSSSKNVADFVRDENGDIYVDENGYVILECRKAGSVTITVTATDGSKQAVKFKLNVVKKIQQMDLKDDKAVIEENGTKRVQVKAGKSIDLSKLVEFVAPEDPTNKKLAWKIVSGNGKPFASINASGKLTTKKVTSDKSLVICATSTDGDDVTLNIFVDILVN